MRRPLVTMLCFALAACGGPPAPPTARRVRASRAPTTEGCPATQTRLGDRCWSAEGTRWRVEADGPGGAYRFDIELMAANRARANDHEAASPSSDEWFQDGPLLRVLLSDRFVEYRARVTNGTVLIGEAWNVRGQRWSWRADRLFGETSCRESEARLEGACMSVAGTRWQVEGEELAPTTLELLREARAVMTPARRAEARGGSWTQRGDELTVELEGLTLRATLTDADTMTGASSRADAAPRPLRATRLESFPPVMHP